MTEQERGELHDLWVRLKDLERMSRENEQEALRRDNLLAAAGARGSADAFLFGAQEVRRLYLGNPKPGYDHGQGPCKDCDDPCEGESPCLAWELWLRGEAALELQAV